MLDKKQLPKKLLWVDLEMTGLYPNKDVILEIATEVTDFNFKKISSYKAVIFQPKEKLKSLNEWSKKQHSESGLLDKVKNGKPETEVINEFILFIKSNFKNEPAILAGNSIHFDRRFIIKWWPEVNNLLHYRMLDVSSLKIIMQGRYGVVFEKQENHRALDDINESIDELKFYLNWLKNK